MDEMHEDERYEEEALFVKRTFADMLDHQRDMQINSFGSDPANLQGQPRKDFATAMAFALTTEVAEAMQEIAWKPWAKTNHFNRDAYLEELIDILHFWFNLALLADADADELIEVYFMKADVNKQRQIDGYTGLDKETESGKL